MYSMFWPVLMQLLPHCGCMLLAVDFVAGGLAEGNTVSINSQVLSLERNAWNLKVRAKTLYVRCGLHLMGLPCTTVVICG